MVLPKCVINKENLNLTLVKNLSTKHKFSLIILPKLCLWKSLKIPKAWGFWHAELSESLTLTIALVITCANISSYWESKTTTKQVYKYIKHSKIVQHKGKQTKSLHIWSERNHYTWTSTVKSGKQHQKYKIHTHTHKHTHTFSLSHTHTNTHACINIHLKANKSRAGT